MLPDTLHLGPIPIHWFGIFLALAVIAGLGVAEREFARKGLAPDLAATAVMLAFVGGIVGARLWVIVGAWSSFVREPLRFALSGGGLAWYGGLLGGVLSVTLLFRARRVRWRLGADALAPAIVLGQAIGRIGCQVAGDGDWGSVTTLPWGMAYPHAVAGWDYPPGVRVHPTPLYECAAYLAIFALLWRRRLRPAPDGALFATYLVMAGLARFAVEFVRINPRVLLGMSMPQLMSIASVVAGAFMLLRSRPQRGVCAMAVVLAPLVLSGIPRVAACQCEFRTIGIDTSLANNSGGIVRGSALGQTFVADDTLVTSLTVWRVANQPNSIVGLRPFIVETDSTGTPAIERMLWDGPPLIYLVGDGIHPTPFTWTMDPPVVLPSRGKYAWYVQQAQCTAIIDIIAVTGSDPYPEGHAWGTSHSLCGVPSTFTFPLPDADRVFTIEFCHDVVTDVRKQTWGELKIQYR